MFLGFGLTGPLNHTGSVLIPVIQVGDGLGLVRNSLYLLVYHLRDLLAVSCSDQSAGCLFFMLHGILLAILLNWME